MNNSFSELLPQFIISLESKKRSPSTILAYRADLAQLISFLEKKHKNSPQLVIAADLEEFRDYLLEQKYTAKSASRKLNAVKTFFRWLVSEGKIKENPSKEVTHPKIEAGVPKFLGQLEY